MLAIVSPAKTLDYTTPFEVNSAVEPQFKEEALYLVKKISGYSAKRIAKLMNVSEEIAQLNFDRFQTFEPDFNQDNSRPAIYAFKGDVYQGLDAYSLDKEQINFLNKHAAILSGLYGVLRPLDLMQPYRMEMGLSFKVTPKKTNLYKYWDNKICEALEALLENSTGEKVLVNLASNEYAKAANLKNFSFPVIECDFQDKRPDGSYKTIGFNAKKARGMMLRFIAENNITNSEHLKAFKSEGYIFNPEFSSKNKWVFTRDN
ncbi:peroxide stress protein YaaA [Luteibaculum oceani]|uniref:UPF0246 protein FRX97_02715 n=1 Tax=Luteibaculum oceani TaxID=1294296 RepID=A0A5C6VBK3_9FLAO|nr:peroxide stress protein YaaA [Luteibaculum oceani]TXC82021.1 peroxide stress protein YaaA [Luteibaculum oceani]